MRVGIVSSGPDNGLAGSLARALRGRGHAVARVDEPRPRRGISHRAALEARHLFPPAMIRDRVVEDLASFGPELIVVVKGSFVRPELIQRLREMGPVVCWNPDSPFDSAVSNSGGMVRSSIEYFDYYVTWSEEVAAPLRDLRDRVMVIPFGFDGSLHRPVPGEGRAAGRVVLVGTASQERLTLIRRLRHVNPLVFGNGWEGTDVDWQPAVYGREFCKISAEARWSLNPLRPQNRHSHNMRTFELAACGAAQLTFATREHREYLSGTRSLLVDSVDELAEAVSMTPPDPSDGIGREHSYEARCELLLDEVMASDVAGR